MKSMIKTIALSLLVVTMSNFAFAGEKSEKESVSSELDVYMAPLVANQVAIVFNKLEGEVVKVKIYDTEGTLIHSDTEVEGTSYAKKFNLGKYPSGKYTYKVSNAVYSVTKVIEIK